MAESSPLLDDGSLIERSLSNGLPSDPHNLSGRRIMHDEIYKKIENDPRFQQLVKRRQKFAWTLSLVMLAIYYTFIMVIAFKPELLAIPLSADTITTVGIPAGVAIIVSAFVLTGIYVHRANSEFDDLNAVIVKEASK